MTLPDFIIIGAMKSGTTSLQDQLQAQPGVFMTTPKEPNFFSDDPVYAQGMAWYSALYDDAPEGALKGEASTHYTKLPTYPQTIARMREVLEAPKLIYMIRNPVARSMSHFIHDWTEGVLSKDVAAAYEHHKILQDYGCYGMQIAPFVEAFGLENIHLTCLEAFKADPQGELDKVQAFLGLPAPITYDPGRGAQNVSAERFRRMPFQDLILNSWLGETLRRKLVPKALRNKIRKARTMDTRPEMPQDVRHRLEAVFLEDRARLAEFFPDHPALELCYPFAKASA